MPTLPPQADGESEPLGHQQEDDGSGVREADDNVGQPSTSTAAADAPHIRDSWRPNAPAPSRGAPSWRPSPPATSQPPIMPPFPPPHAPFHTSAASGFPPRPPSHDGNWRERRAPSEPSSDDRVRDRWSPSWPAEQVEVQYRHEERTRSGGRFAPSSSSGGRSPAYNRSSPGPMSPPQTGSFRGLNSPGRSRQDSPAPVMLPPGPYVDISREAVQHSEEPTPKLLVLDLNGALVYRTAHTGAARKAYPRPFLNCFLQYVFLPEPEGGPRPWEVFVWSSAQPHNVRHMVETTFGERWIEGVWTEEDRLSKVEREQRGEGRLLGVWARDKMNLGNDYNRKVQTTKDLRKVGDHFIYDLNDSRFDESNMVLLDDSPLKAVYQPWSQIVIPEFDKPEYQASNVAAQRLNVRKASGKPVGSEKDGGRSLRSKSQATTPPTASELADEPGLDNILLAVIGILEESRHVQNFPSWVRRGGIQHPGKPLGTVGNSDVTLEDLPSHETFEHWFKDKDTHSYWAERGIEALNRKGIEVTHGLNIGASGEAMALGEGSASRTRQGTPPAPRARQHTPPAPRARPSRNARSQFPGYGDAEDGGHEAQIAFNFLKSIADGNRRLNRGQQKVLQRAVSVLTEMGYGPVPDDPADYSMEGDDAYDEEGVVPREQWEAATGGTPPPDSHFQQPNSDFQQSDSHFQPPDDSAHGMDVEMQQTNVVVPPPQTPPRPSAASGGIHPDRLRELALNPPSPNSPEDKVDPGVAYAAARSNRGNDTVPGPPKPAARPSKATARLANATAGPSKKSKATPVVAAPAQRMFFSPFPDNDELRSKLGIAPFYQTEPNAAGSVDSLLEADKTDIRFLRRLDEMGLEMTMAQAVAAESLLKKLVAGAASEQDKTTVANVVTLARHRLGLVVAPPGPSLEAVLADYQALGIPDKQPSKKRAKPGVLTRSARRSMARAQANDEPPFMSFDDLLRFGGRPEPGTAAPKAAPVNPKAKGKAAGKAKAKSTTTVAAKATAAPATRAEGKKRPKLTAAQKRERKEAAA
ncbi:hypothetical protein Q8F55_004207 [Vanrija albida]|uniref:FCP1 homology domain-containing protein n=1 Tax=Vanrija albida TaxID=181172 RepID=A0ABR3Q6F3_9TREE